MRQAMQYIIYRSATVILVLAAAGLIDSCNLNDEWDKNYENAPDQTGENVLTMIAENENYSTFYNALVENGYGSFVRPGHCAGHGVFQLRTWLFLLSCMGP